MERGRDLEPSVKAWLDHVIIPALVQEYVQLFRTIPRRMVDNGLGSASDVADLIPDSERIP